MIDYLKNKTILEVHLALDKKSIKFICEDGDHIDKADGDCCSNSWIEYIELPATGLPCKVLNIEKLETKSFASGEYDTVIQKYGYKIETDKGDLVIDYRNDIIRAPKRTNKGEVTAKEPNNKLSNYIEVSKEEFMRHLNSDKFASHWVHFVSPPIELYFLKSDFDKCESTRDILWPLKREFNFDSPGYNYYVNKDYLANKECDQSTEEL